MWISPPIILICVSSNIGLICVNPRGGWSNFSDHEEKENGGLGIFSEKYCFEIQILGISLSYSSWKSTLETCYWCQLNPMQNRNFRLDNVQQRLNPQTWLCVDHDLHLQNSKSTSESVYNDPAASLLRKSNLRTLEFECICEGMEFAGLKIRNLRKFYVRMIGEACLTNAKEKSRKLVHWNGKYQKTNS